MSETSPNSTKLTLPAQDFSILIVEDMESNRMLLKSQLKIIGYTADFVKSGEEALSHLKSHAYDFILMDMQLPGIDGSEVTETIRSSSEYGENQNAYIVAITASAIGQDIYRCLRSGMNDYLGKPLTIESLKKSFSDYQHWAGSQ